MSRLPAQPGERIDRSALVRSPSTAAGRRVRRRHDRLALYACGVRTLALVQVPPAPRRAVAPVSARTRSCSRRRARHPRRQRAGARGDVVEHLNTWPSLARRDARDRLVGGPFIPPGFYYKTFICPRALWPLYEKVLRDAAGLGRLPAPRPTAMAHRVPPPPLRRAGRRRRPAGLRPRSRPRRRAPRVLVDEDVGPAARCSPRAATSRPALAERGRARRRRGARRPRRSALRRAGPDLAGLDPDQARAAPIVVATGAIEQPSSSPATTFPA